MFTRNGTLITLILVAAFAIADESPQLGEELTAEQIVAVSFIILPNGEGLPEGSGNALRGESVYQANCLACHGAAGQDGVNDRLAGGLGSIHSKMPVKTVGSYWPYATTVFDYIRRAMPFQAPGSLSDDDIYSLTAYLLYLNEIVNKDTEINAHSLPRVKMPNRDNFVWAISPK
jgi:mono/diheme cytochrome c family protein